MVAAGGQAEVQWCNGGDGSGSSGLWVKGGSADLKLVGSGRAGCAADEGREGWEASGHSAGQGVGYDAPIASGMDAAFQHLSLAPLS